MSWTEDARIQSGLTERCFELSGIHGPVPGVYWAPKGAKPAALVLLGHGGTRHKKVDYILGVAQQLAAKGIASFAIDGPGHGDRAKAKFTATNFSQLWNEGGGHEGMLADWHAALNFVETEQGALPTGWWGLSMGTMMGLPVCVQEQRIKVALLGLMGAWGPNGEELKAAAPKLSIPIRFLIQWDDEVVPRGACLELFGSLGSKRKTLHANPGAHAAVPQFEIAASVDFLAQNLAKLGDGV